MSIINQGTEGLPSQPFRTHAEKYLEMDLSVFPCGKDDGKKPLVTWKPFQAKFPTQNAIYNWYDDFPDANVAIVTGKLSNLTVVDCDNPDISLAELLKDYGDTPLIELTPRGGYHLYYAYNGESNTQDKIQKIDIKGQGGYVVAPPSINRVKNTPYQFIVGDIWEIKKLPKMLKSALKQNVFSTGERNKALFNYLKKQAPECSSYEALQILAFNFNEQKLSPALTQDEVARTANSVWIYKEKGLIFNAGEQKLILNMERLNSLKFEHQSAFAMYVDLLQCHRGVNEVFAICPKGYAKRCGWSENTIRKYIKTLISSELIKLIHQGGKRGKHDPSLFKLI
jgi:hypothetical protein